MSKTKDPALLTINGLKTHYPLKKGFFGRSQGIVKAVDGVSLSIPKGQTLGLVGESGSGKTTIGRAIVRLAPVSEGSIQYAGQELTGLSKNDFFAFRKKIQMVFQDPFNSLNPRMRIESILAEPLDIHFPKLSKQAKRERIAELLESVHLQADHMHRFPHEFSGGQRQRIGIARALAVEPELIICDEPVSALDVSVQAQIVNLLQDLQEKLDLTYLFIAHDMAVVEHISHHVCVLYRGNIVEEGEPHSLCASPQHPYTQSLINASC